MKVKIALTWHNGLEVHPLYWLRSIVSVGVCKNYRTQKLLSGALSFKFDACSSSDCRTCTESVCVFVQCLAQYKFSTICSG